MRKKGMSVVALLLLAVLVILCRYAGDYLRNTVEKGRETGAGAVDGNLVVLDAGHGGPDGGKTGLNGALEKDINLKIAKYIKELLEAEDVQVIMTREGDDRPGETQVGDLKKRVELINQSKPVLAVSIHQNSYHEESVHGGQVFYYETSEEGKRAAQILQKSIGRADEGNEKSPKENLTYYLLRKTEVPVVIVECGFLSNFQEAEKLVTEAYQRKMAEAVTEGILEYIEERTSGEKRDATGQD